MFDRDGLRRTMRSSALMLSTAAAAITFSPLFESADAQTLAAAPPVMSNVDENGVDLVTGALNYTATEVVIGQPGAGGLAYSRTYIGPGWRDNYVGTINSSGSVYTVSVGGGSETFTLSGGVYTSDQASGSTLTVDSGTGDYTYQTADGTIAIFDNALANGGASFDANVARVTSMTLPNGERITFHYKSVNVQSTPALRLQSVTNNLGYQLHFEYSNNNPTLASQLDAWRTLAKVTGINNAVDYCDPTANSCTGLTQTWPHATYAVSIVSGSYHQTVTDALSQTTIYIVGGTNGLGGIRRPSSPSTNHVSITYNLGRVANVTYGTSPNFVSYTYSYSDNSGVRTLTRTNPNSTTREVVSNLTTVTVTADTNELGDTVSYEYDSNERVTRITLPEGNYTQFTYDTRGNVTETRQVDKAGPHVDRDIVSLATFPGSCSNPITCNLPTSTTDPMGNVTEYTYDATHGGVLTITLPDPDAGGSLPRPETRFDYASLYAYYKNSGGTIVQAATPVWQLTETSACATSAWSGSACSVGNADETTTTIDYGSTGVANNRLPLSVTTAAGDASISATVASTYDSVGNLLTTDGPLSGSADTTRYRYDAVRALIGVVGPDPDGGGSLKHRALRFTYNVDGQQTMAERGTVNSQSDGDWASFASLQQFNTSYDFIGRRTMSAMTANSATHFVTQFSYDNASRLECVAVRMNPAYFATPPASACSLGIAGANGPDRITRTTYSAANQPTMVTTGYGVAAVNEWTATYTDNGLLSTLADASGNLTTNEYDDQDRLHRIRFPNTSGGGSSTTDDEVYTYDRILVTDIERRDGSALEMTYDHLLRVTNVDATTNGENIVYAYDNFGRTLEAETPSQTLEFAYDQLSRNTSQESPLGVVSYQYDDASRRTRITWPGSSFCAQYAYDLANAVTQISAEGGSCNTTTLASYGYDDLGRRVSVNRGNSTSEAVAYNDAGLISSLAQDLDDGGSDQTLTFNYNAATQIISRTGSDADYAWTPLAPGTTNYVDNGLNQYTSAGGVAQHYDDRGNLETGGFGYDIRNNLTSGPSSTTLAYDPIGRLYETDGAATTRFLYDGIQIIAEYDDTNALLRRFVPGPALDEPIVWYEGSGSGDRRWFVADERNSIIAITNSSGVATNINRYDEYGIPDAANAGRFQYTGQAWIGEIARYHYRARTYAPLTGRFQQTDPRLVAGGMNLYAYVYNDPINRTDPLGLFWVLTGCTVHGAGDSLTVECNRAWVRLQMETRGGETRGEFADGGSDGSSEPSLEDQVRALYEEWQCQEGATIDAARDIQGFLGHVEGEAFKFQLYGIVGTAVAPESIVPEAMVLAGGAVRTAAEITGGWVGFYLAARGDVRSGVQLFTSRALDRVGTFNPFEESGLGDLAAATIDGIFDNYTNIPDCTPNE